jgi:hypothetical protein
VRLEARLGDGSFRHLRGLETGAIRRPAQLHYVLKGPKARY